MGAYVPNDRNGSKPMRVILILGFLGMFFLGIDVGLLIAVRETALRLALSN